MTCNLLKRHWWFALTLCVVVGCTTQAPTEKPADAATTPAQLSPAEAKSYHDALARIEKGEAEKAIGNLKKLVQTHSNQAGIWLNLAIAQYHGGDLEEAKASLARAQSLSTRMPESYNLAGLIAVDQGDYATAEKHYKAALKFNKNFADAHYNLALLYDIFYQDIGRAVEAYQNYLALNEQEDKATAAWVEELKLTLKRRGQ